MTKIVAGAVMAARYLRIIFKKLMCCYPTLAGTKTGKLKQVKSKYENSRAFFQNKIF